MRIGIDVGGTKIEGVLLDGRRTIRRERVPTPGDEGYRAIVGCIAGLVGSLDAEAGARPSVGVGIPGTISRRTGLVKNANTTCLIGEPLQADLDAALGRPVRIANDANCFAVAEALGGAGRGADVVFGVILGTGVGGGVVIGGEAREGPHGIAGEWGHSPIEDRAADAPPAPRCYCGLDGCVETRLSGPALERDHARLSGGPRLSASDVVARVAAGDAAAGRAFDRYLGFFGEGIARVIHVLDPDVIVLGGGMANTERLYVEGPPAVERMLFSRKLVTPIRQNELGDSAGVFGAAWLWPGGGPG